MTPKPLPDMRALGQHPDFRASKVVGNEAGDFCWVEPYPTEADLAEYYESNYRATRREGPTSHYVAFMSERARIQKAFVCKAARQDSFNSILDIGSGCGALLESFKDVAAEAVGYEADREMTRFAQNRFGSHSLQFRQSLFVPTLYDGPKFDLVLMSHVLEHVPHPAAFVGALRDKVLAELGLVFIEVPNDPLFWVEKQVQWQLRGLAHLNFFTENSLRNLFMSSGFEIEAIALCGDDLASQIRALRPLWKLARGLRKLRQYIKPDPENFSIMPNYSPVRNGRDAVYIQLLARRV